MFQNKIYNFFNDNGKLLLDIEISKKCLVDNLINVSININYQDKNTICNDYRTPYIHSDKINIVSCAGFGISFDGKMLGLKGVNDKNYNLKDFIVFQNDNEANTYINNLIKSLDNWSKKYNHV